MSYFLYNVLELIFWMTLAVIAVLIKNVWYGEFRHFAMFSAAIFFFFGLSDLVELKLGSFLKEGMEWLFIWKVMCVAGMIFALFWYFKLRLQQI